MMENPIKNEEWLQGWNNEDNERIDQVIVKVGALIT